MRESGGPREKDEHGRKTQMEWFKMCKYTSWPPPFNLELEKYRETQVDLSELHSVVDANCTSFSISKSPFNSAKVSQGSVWLVQTRFSILGCSLTRQCSEGMLVMTSHTFQLPTSNGGQGLQPAQALEASSKNFF